MSAPLLHLEGVARSVRLPDGSWLEILRRIDLTVRAGEHVGIVGRSGTGKSTLLNILGLLDRPTGGHMLWDGTPTARLSQRAASRIRGAQIGFVFQQFNLLPGRTALENVAHPLLYGTAAEVRTRKRRAREVLERLGLGERADQVPTRLSGGEQQRVAIAVCSLTPVVAMSTMAQDSLRTSYEQMSGRACARSAFWPGRRPRPRWRRSRSSSPCRCGCRRRSPTTSPRRCPPD